MVRLLFYPLFSEDQFFAPLKVLDRIGGELVTGSQHCEIHDVPKRTSVRSESPLSRLKSLARRRKRQSSCSDVEDETICNSDSKLAVTYNVCGYKPEELSVRIVENSVVVNGKREEESGDGYERREFSRRFALPDGVDAETVTCSLSANGVLVIEASKAVPPSKKTRTIPISVEQAVDHSAAVAEAQGAVETASSA